MGILAILLMAASFSSPDISQEHKAMDTQLIPFETLADSPWKPIQWAGRPFIFLSYAGDWSKAYQRVAHECRIQGLLTPTWDDPSFPHPVESSATEWGWSVRPEGKNKRECYEWLEKLYLDRITKHAHSNAPMEGKKPRFSYP